MVRSRKAGEQKHVLEMNWGGEKLIKRKAVPGRDSLISFVAKFHFVVA